MSDSEEEKKPSEELDDKPLKKKKDKKKKKEAESYGPVGKTVVNLRKSIGHVTKTVIGKEAAPVTGEEKQEINLAELEVIEIEDSDEENVGYKHGEKSAKIKRSDIAYFDYMPDEVIFNIFNRLPEKDMGRFACTCKRLYAYMEEEDIWKKKAQNWINLRVSRGNKASENLREFYVAKYKENEQKEEAQRLARIQQEKRLKRDNRIKNTIATYNSTIFNYRTYDIPICLCVILWTVFMAIRADEYILWSYHLVFLPLYVGYFYVAVSCFMAFPAAQQATDNSIYPTYQKNLLALIAEETKLWGFLIVGAPWSITLSFFLIYAFVKESDGLLTESFAFIPIAMVAIPAFFTCCGVFFF